ncbi:MULTISPECIES: DUF2859 domain-containing protein [Vibrio]|uniref:DUF2859 domain-containing protein n=1 Tax=Vibrio TaxID=662 RepID=UPI0008415656|nr:MULTISPECIES: DUF2859 domain-containing protein [Vibrio]ODM56990.1 hypothetical protein BC455_18020 [Vibrio harveyi]USD58666.1 DUF2859 domain-containing protein [Vibrio sp. SCSIO 43155]
MKLKVLVLGLLVLNSMTNAHAAYEDSASSNIINPEYKSYQDHLAKKQKQELEEKYKGLDVDLTLSEKVLEYLPDTYMDKKTMLEMNQTIVRSVIYSGIKQIAGKATTKVLVDNNENTTSISSLIDPENYPPIKASKEQLLEREMSNRMLNGQVTKKEIYNLYEQMIFPVSPEKIKPRVMPADYLEVNEGYENALNMPLAVIGMDNYSLEWLRLNREEVKRNGSIVLLTQVDSMTDYDALRREYPELQILPINAEGAMAEIGVDFYPVLMTRNGIFQ